MARESFGEYELDIKINDVKRKERVSLENLPSLHVKRSRFANASGIFLSLPFILGPVNEQNQFFS